MNETTEEVLKKNKLILEQKLKDIKQLEKERVASIQYPTPTEEEITEMRIQLADCYEKIIRIFKEYVDMPEEKIKMISIWTMGTYFHKAFLTYPYLFFNAMRGSGKTRTLKLISSLGAKGDGSVQNNLTEAVLFRVPQGTTTCIDEIEQIGTKEKQTLRELLNSAYKKGMKVKRMRKVRSESGENQEVETFEPYFPIAMANIWGMDEVLGDRSITMILEKSNNPAITKMIEDFDTNDTIMAVKRTLEAISVVYVVSLLKKTYTPDWNKYIKYKYSDTTTYTTLTTQTTYNNTTNERKEVINNLEMEEFFNKIDELNISGRNFELLFPLLLVAKELGEEVFEEILKIGSEIMNLKKEDEYHDSKDVSLFEFLCTEQIRAYGLQLIPLKELTSKFRTFLGEHDDEDKWLNDKWFGRALKRLNLTLTKKRVASGRLVMINFGKAEEKLKIFKYEDD